ncbi:F-box domain-containing protein [Salix suchowensis]|nr:F-box domain-containing protein [Salix suchowensis]
MGFFNLLDLSSGRRAQCVNRLDHCLSPRRQPTRRIVKIPTPVHMPMEVVLTILEAAYYDDSLQANDRLLKDCALVCRSWSVPAQKLLFSNVKLRTERACSAFTSAVNPSSERGRMLGESVIRMRAVLDHNQPSHLLQTSFARAVTLCPNLYELNLSVYGCGAPGDDVVGAPDVSRMSRPAPSFEDDTLELLKSGPAVRALTSAIGPRIGNHYPNFSMSGRRLSPSSLAALPLNFLRPQRNPTMLSRRTTHELSKLEREPSVEQLDFLVATHGHALHSLSLPACGSHEHALAVQQCQQLRELKIESQWVSPMVYKKIPEEIQHVAFGLDRDTALQPIIDVVKARPNLRAVTVHVWKGGELHPHLPALKIACAYRGIELQTTRDIQVFRALTRGDPVPNNGTFPRVRSIENLNYMRC